MSSIASRPPSGRSTASATSASLGRPAAPARRGAASGAGTGKRGRPRGSGNRAQQALKLVTENPGITIPDMAQRMGIQVNYLYRVLPNLEQDGKVRKEGRGWFPKG